MTGSRITSRLIGHSNESGTVEARFAFIQRRGAVDAQYLLQLVGALDRSSESALTSGSRVNTLSARFRHYNIRLLLFSTQVFRYVSNVVRQNTTNLIVGSPFPNHKELLKVAEEFGDVVGGQEKWLLIYHTACRERYDFLHMDLQSNPVKCYRNFTDLISEGEYLVHCDSK